MRLEDLRDIFRNGGHVVSPRDDVDERAAAWYFECAVGTLANWRTNGKGPPWIRLPSGIKYPIGGLANYLESLVRREGRRSSHARSRRFMIRASGLIR